MNAAARLVHQNMISRHLMLVRLFTRKQVTIVCLMFAIILSALSIIYVTHTTRVLTAGYQHDLMDQTRLHAERSQLLLERSAWMIPSHVEQIAENKLGMMTPDHDSVVVIREK